MRRSIVAHRRGRPLLWPDGHMHSFVFFGVKVALSQGCTIMAVPYYLFTHRLTTYGSTYGCTYRM